MAIALPCKNKSFTKLQEFFDGEAWHFSYTHACKSSITPSGNTVWQHQCGRQTRACWPDCARYSAQGCTKGAESLWMRQITAGGTEWLWGAPKSPYNVTSTFFNTVHLLLKDLRFEHGVVKVASCPGRHLSSLCPWFCRTLTKSCQFHCQITNNVSQIILPIFCKTFSLKFKRFTLTMDPILIVLAYSNLFRQNWKFEIGGPGPARKKVGDLDPCGPRFRHLCICFRNTSGLNMWAPN